MRTFCRAGAALAAACALAGAPHAFSQTEAASAPDAISAPDRRPGPSRPPRDNAGDSTFRGEQTKALAGDKDAAYRLSEMYRSGSNGVARDARKTLQWLHYASDIGSGAASYQLYLHYLERGRDREALRFETRARDQGFQPPPRLDPRRG